MTPVPPSALLQYLHEGRCVLFAGSGLSAWAGLPTWGRLLGALCAEVSQLRPDSPEAAELESLLAEKRYLEVAEYCQQKLGEFRFAERLREELRAASEEVPKPHRILVDLPFAGIITTNYDPLLERSFARCGKPMPRVLTHQDRRSLGSLLFGRGRYVLKAHGDLDREGTLVLTAREYRELIHTNPAFAQVFSAILLTHAVLFVGYSLSDPDFQLLLDRQLTLFDHHVPPRYALMTGLGQVERDVLWNGAAIQTLSYDVEPGHPDGKHHQVLRFLEALATGLEERNVRDSEVERSDLGRGPIDKDRGGGVLLEPGGGTPKYPLPPDIDDDHRPTRGHSSTASYSLPDLDAKVSLGGRPQPNRLSSSEPLREPRETLKPSPPVYTLTLRMGTKGLRSRFSDDETVAEGTGPLPNLRRIAGPLQQSVDWSSSGASEALRRVGSLLGDSLAPEVREMLGGLPEGSLLRLEVPRELARLPWEWAHHDGEPMGLRWAMARTALDLDDAARGRPATGGRPAVLLLADPSGNLAGALDEAAAIADSYQAAGGSCAVLAGDEATVERLIAEIATARWDVIHFAGHGWFDDQEAYLVLAGGHRLRASELRSFVSPRPPALLVLNTHFSAFVPPGVGVTLEGLAGGLELEPRAHGRDGFTETALEAGAGAVLGTFGSVSDAVAADVGVAFHQGLLEGLPAAEALRNARAAAPPGDSSDPSGMYYTLSGYPDLRWK